MINVYKIESKALGEAKKILEAQEVPSENIEAMHEDKEMPVKEVKKNYFARNGYLLRDAKSMGFNKDCYYLYIDGPHEFFKDNERLIISIKGITKLSGKEYDEVKRKIEDELSGAESGIGSVFEGF